jgi:acetoin utilization deacetylase AcuC-like enzyme
MLLITSPRFEEHVTPPGHPERPERARVFQNIAMEWRERGGRVSEPRTATMEELLRVHTREHVDRIAATSGRPGVMLDPDTFTSPESYDVALLAAGAAVQAMEHALDTGETAFALVRPPGHHAEPDRAMGFCLFNNIAIAAAAALARRPVKGRPTLQRSIDRPVNGRPALQRSIERVAIVDIDVHHGNGTQDVFYEEPRVLYLSTHQFPFYPGTGAAEETGAGRGKGFTMNVPLAAGSTDADYDRAYDSVAARLAEYDPQVLLVSAGYDAHMDDPLASMYVSVEGYGAIVRKVLGATRAPAAFITEGGYDLHALSACISASIDEILARENSQCPTPNSQNPTPNSQGEPRT